MNSSAHQWEWPGYRNLAWATCPQTWGDRAYTAKILDDKGGAGACPLYKYGSLSTLMSSRELQNPY